MSDNTATIIIPVLDQRADFLNQCVRSATSQTFPVDVLVVLSTETPQQTRAMLDGMQAELSGVQVIMQKRRGFAAAINTGIEAATTERVGLLLSDDWLEPQAVEKCLPFGSDIVSTGRRVFKADGLVELAHFSGCPSQARYEAEPTLQARAAYLEHFFLFRRDALLAIGGVDESIGQTAVDDYDMIWTLLENGATVTVIPDPLYNYRDHSGLRLSLRDADTSAAEMAAILDKHGVVEPERSRLLKSHRQWSGQTLEEAAAEIRRNPVGWARETWRVLRNRSPVANAFDIWLRRRRRR